MTLQELLLTVFRHGFEYAFKRFPGLYRGTVVDVRDPQKRGRVRATVHAVGSEPLQAWFDPVVPQAGPLRGWFLPPAVGDSVVVAFDLGDPSKPLVYLGGWFGYPSNRSEVPTDLGYDAQGNPRRFGWVSRLGHALIFDETPGSERVELRWRKPAPGDGSLRDATVTASGGKRAGVAFEPDGSVMVTSGRGASIRLDDTANSVRVDDSRGTTVTIDASGVRVASPGNTVRVEAATVELAASSVQVGEGADEGIPRGMSLLRYLASHTHGSGTGPTTAPIVPPGQDLISRVAKVAP